MVRSLQTDSIIVSHLMKIVVLITILFIILAVAKSEILSSGKI